MSYLDDNNKELIIIEVNQMIWPEDSFTLGNVLGYNLESGLQRFVTWTEEFWADSVAALQDLVPKVSRSNMLMLDEFLLLLLLLVMCSS